MTFKVLTLNNIALAGLRRLPRDLYEVASEIGHPDAILLRSANMHEMDIPASVKAVARAGAGVNNIPIDELAARGVPVFNAPGANANAVKELVIAGMFVGARNICQAWNYVRELDGDDSELAKAVEAGKKRFAGFELPGRTLGVIGLGAIGVQVANATLLMGMKVIGFDPQMTVERAWQLNSGVEQARSLDQLFRRSDFVTVHVPMTEKTTGLVNAERLAQMKEGGVLLNFARGGIVDEPAVLGALDSGRLSAYISDFPSNVSRRHPKVTALPHLGASTGEAEDNCAIMVAENLREYLENGNISHSVNFPETIMPRTEGRRLAVANLNVPNMVGQISTHLADAGLNIIDLLNKSLGPVAYTLVDVENSVSSQTLVDIAAIEGVLNVRVL
jgi:D-3-phosphoglycerate dehydrogenase